MKLRACALTTIAASILFVGCETDGTPELPEPTPAPSTGDPDEGSEETEATPQQLEIDTEPEPTPTVTDDEDAADEEPTPTPTPEPDTSVGSLPYGIPVPGKPGFVISPHSRNSGYVDVRGFPPASEVKDPYSGQTFLVP
ncbi:MAG: hypothetical protein WA771_13415 [Chthoniobacterales bacterium]